MALDTVSGDFSVSFSSCYIFCVAYIHIIRSIYIVNPTLYHVFLQRTCRASSKCSKRGIGRARRFLVFTSSLHSSLQAMAPYLAESQRSQLHDLITSTMLGDIAIAGIVNCSRCTVTHTQSNLQTFGDPYPLAVHTRGRRSCILPHVLAALLNRLLCKPELYLDEMADFIWDEYKLHVS